MKRSFLFLALAASMMLGACEKEQDSESPREEGVVDSSSADAMIPSNGSLAGAYITLNQFWLDEVSDHGIAISFFNDLGYMMKFEDNSVFVNGSDRYKEYARSYGDTLYPRSVVCLWANYVSASPLLGIEVKSDKDFDDNHPAGSSLNDVFVFEYESIYDCIKNDYIDAEEMHCMQSDLSDFKGINMLSDVSVLRFKKLPVYLGKYTFTVNLEFGNDPVTGEEVKLEPVSIVIEFK